MREIDRYMKCRFDVLLNRYIDHTATREELKEFLSSIESSDFDEFLKSCIDDDVSKTPVSAYDLMRAQYRVPNSIRRESMITYAQLQFWADLRDKMFKNFKDYKRYDNSLNYAESLPPAVFSNTGEIVKMNFPEYGKIISEIRIVDQSILNKIKGNIKDIHNLTPRQFEEMVAELLEKMGYTVHLTPLTNDGGKDIIVASNNDIGSFMYYVECKKYSHDNPVNLGLVKQLYATVIADKVTAGLLITTSHFTKGAKEFAKNQIHQLSLIDYLKLMELIRKH